MKASKHTIIWLSGLCCVLLICLMVALWNRSTSPETQTLPTEVTAVVPETNSDLRIRGDLTRDDYQGNTAVETWLDKELTGSFGARVLCTRQENGTSVYYQFLVRMAGECSGAVSGDLVYHSRKGSDTGYYDLQLTVPPLSDTGETLFWVSCTLPPEERAELTLLVDGEEVEAILTRQNDTLLEPGV